jgi:hypothetical protein
LLVAAYLRDEIARGPGWKKMRRNKTTNSLRSCVKKVFLMAHSNFITSMLDALSEVGPDPVLDENSNPLLAEAVE